MSSVGGCSNSHALKVHSLRQEGLGTHSKGEFFSFVLLIKVLVLWLRFS